MNNLKQRDSMDLNLRTLLAVLSVIVMPLLSFSVYAYDAPPKDQGHSGPQCQEPTHSPNNEPKQCTVGNPVNVKTGNSFTFETDISIPALGFPLALERSYNTQNSGKEGPFGYGWTFSFDVTLVEVEEGNEKQVIIKWGDGTERAFVENSDGSYTSPVGRFLTLTKSAGVYVLADKHKIQHHFDSNGRLAAKKDPNNDQLTFSYDSSGKLIEIVDTTARKLVFTYNKNNKISQVVDPANRIFLYTYDVNNNLISVTDPNAFKKEYGYDEFHRIVSKKDKKGIEIVRNTYDDQNRIIQQFYKGANVRFTYNDNYTQVCNRRNYCTNYYYNETGNPIRINRPVVGSSYRTYDEDLNVIQYRDERNSIWNYTYDSSGNLLTETDPNNHTTTYTYESNFNKVTSIIDANQNVTKFEYDAKGNLIKITNALNQVIYKATYDVNGNPSEIEDVNGIKTLFSYNQYGQLLSSSIDGAITTFTYNDIGDLNKITLPDNKEITYSYDTGGRLTEIKDNESNKIQYTLDAEGNIIAQQIFDSQGTVTQKQSWVFDDFNRTKESISADNRRTIYEYDNNDNVIKLTDALSHITQSSYDGLDRLTQVVDALSGITKLSYDNEGRIARVTDPAGLFTRYIYDKVGNLTSLTSPDTGVTTQTYDETNNLITSTDARGITTTYSYDALQRLTAISYPNSAENISYSYDDTTNGNYGTGRLTGYSDQSGQTALQYDAKGQLLNEEYSIEGAVYNILYRYDSAGKLTQLTYPSGRVVDYAYNNLGEVFAVTTTFNGITKTIANNIRYLPFGPMLSMTYGNGLVLNQTFDQNYRLLAKEVNGVFKLNYAYSPIDNISSLTDDLNTAENQTFAYDALFRLTSASGGYGELAYSYDKVGNRLTESDDGLIDNYTYATDSHHLQNITGGNNTAFTYDAVGNTLTKNGISFVYNDRGRMAQADNNGVAADYLYNAKGQRVVKKIGSNIVHFHYDPAGHLIAESTAAGDSIREYVYLGREPLAAIDPVANGRKVYFIHTDHLGTPKSLTDESGTRVWKADYEPFGEKSQSVNLITFNLRFPGQYYDAETGLNYNYFRDYDSRIGRYLQSDPIGLGGGENTYAYVSNDPIYKTDFLGLVGENFSNYCKKRLNELRKRLFWEEMYHNRRIVQITGNNIRILKKLEAITGSSLPPFAIPDPFGAADWVINRFFILFKFHQQLKLFTQLKFRDYLIDESRKRQKMLRDAIEKLIKECSEPECTS